MKNPLVPALSTLALASAALANTVVTLDFATDLTGITSGGDAALVEHDPTNGGRLKYTANAGWRPSCVVLDFNATAELQEVWAQLVANGGTLSYTVTVEPPGLVADTPPDPQPANWGNPNWFENMVFCNTAGQAAIGPPWTLLSLYGGTFPLLETRTQLTTITIESSATVDTADQVIQISPDGSSILSIGLNSESTAFNSGTLYLDNLTIDALGAPPPLVIPTLDLQKARPGLQLISSPAGAFDRQGIRTTSPDYSWVGATTYPVTYALDIAEFPPLAGYRASMYFVPGSGLPTTMSYPDWAQPVCGLVWITSNAAGGGDMNFAYKDDAANGGGNGSNGVTGHEYWVNDDGTGQGGSLAVAQSDTMIGTWSVTFTSPTEVTIQTPQGTTASAQFLQTTVDKFAGNMYVYFAAFPEQTANIGQTAIFKQVSITGGVATPFTQVFDAPAFDPLLLEIAAAAPASVLQVSRAESPFFLSWSLPASGFGVYHSPNLIPGEWLEIPSADAFTIAGPAGTGTRYKLLYNSELGTTTGFLRLEKP